LPIPDEFPAYLTEFSVSILRPIGGELVEGVQLVAASRTPSSGSPDVLIEFLTHGQCETFDRPVRKTESIEGVSVKVAKVVLPGDSPPLSYEAKFELENMSVAVSLSAPVQGGNEHEMQEVLRQWVRDVLRASEATSDG
jgi:hypothetical protein